MYVGSLEKQSHLWYYFCGTTECLLPGQKMAVKEVVDGLESAFRPHSEHNRFGVFETILFLSKYLFSFKAGF